MSYLELAPPEILTKSIPGKKNPLRINLNKFE